VRDVEFQENPSNGRQDTTVNVLYYPRKMSFVIDLIFNVTEPKVNNL
jgi:hypothetical protein